MKILDSKPLLYGVIIISILIIGGIDYFTGSELSFSLFYVFPILLLSVKRTSKVYEIVLMSLFAGTIWFWSDYHTRSYSSVLYPIWNSFVRFSYFTAIGLLLHFLKNRERTIIKMNKKLNLLNDEKNKFIGIAAHDLANPIGTIYSFSDLLLENQKEQMDAEMEESLTIIKDLSHTTLGILKNLLNVSVIESGKLELKREENDYIGFINKQIVFNQLLASKKKINIKFEPALENVVVGFDKLLLSQVFNNLLTNAIKFSYPESEIVVRISLNNDNQIYTEVIDQGKGIPEAEKNKLFNYFQKTSTQPTNGENSSGLGLAIAKQIISLHHGTIGVVTELNKGSNFYYTLPVETVTC
ncbi:HAMP domain-containing sensor histidine kinase [Flavobacterium sp. NG2]|uniref:sensor histidine kinase n=1 Tax=Flavobacterium sp. NG2 TaxID=3097547 RepID=UPI002A800155|nr:HAMP domain-containing sensor histidine kinase [Flavobacterium sp. NG2]WPR72408.1 HAMP domain-containing sensor histidine kinase [Flavobacterium sp. NG2]